MFQNSIKKVWSAILCFVSIVSLANSLRAHDAGKNSTSEEIEAHRKADFGFDGFDKLNKQLQKDFAKFDFRAAAAAYRRSLRAQAPLSAGQFGQWSPVFNLPIVAIHAAVLPNGKILMWDSVGDLPAEHYEVHNTTRAIVWDPATGNAARYDVNTGFNLFCAGHAALPDGRQFIAGGNLNSNLDGLDTIHTFNDASNSWTLLGRMPQGGRWYPSVTALPNGEMLITAGGPMTPEIYTNAGTVRSLTDAVLAMPYYPWLQTAPNGRAFYFGPDDNLRYLNTSGNGSWQHIGQRDGFDREYGSYAMYDTGKILAAGGEDSIKHTVVIDINGTSPQVTQANDMAFGRRQHNLTVLPDGTVLATGGNSSGEPFVDLNAGVYAAELWNPSTGAWQTLANMQKTRQYHSMALLLPDARVLVGGGGICGDCQYAGYLEKNIEIFSPPYLFKSDGSPAIRPVINSSPSQISYRNSFSLSTGNPRNISQVVLIRPSSVTHSINFEQRRIPLKFSVVKKNLQVQPPFDAFVAPKGIYLLFVIDNNGVPSVAKTVKVS